MTMGVHARNQVDVEIEIPRALLSRATVATDRRRTTDRTLDVARRRSTSLDAVRRRLTRAFRVPFLAVART
jgi:hypothetical protein